MRSSFERSLWFTSTCGINLHAIGERGLIEIGEKFGITARGCRVWRVGALMCLRRREEPARKGSSKWVDFDDMRDQLTGDGAMNRLGTLVLASIVWVVLALFATSSIAAPQGVVNLGQKLFQFNVIAKPGPWNPTDGNTCNGARIFFGQNNAGSGNTMGTITWTLDPSVSGFQVTDCNGVTDATAASRPMKM